MLNKKLNIVILAAGKGERMRSTLPKVLNTIGGKTMLQHVIETVMQLNNIKIYIVYGYGGELLRKEITQKYLLPLHWVFQSKQLGTGHAIQQVLPMLNDDEEIIILYGDVPLVSLSILNILLEAKPEKGISLLTAKLKNPNGYGRIIRKDGILLKIIEEKKLNKQERYINEVNTGILAISGYDLKLLFNELIKCSNFQDELYLTDVIAIAYSKNYKINTIQLENNTIEVEGVNNHLQLSRLERWYQRKQAERLLLSGVKLADPFRFDLRGELSHGQDIYIDTNVIIEGIVILGNRISIGTGCLLKNVTVKDDVVINPYTIIEDSFLDEKSTVGPFARLRSGSRIGEKASVGNFVEIKKSNFGKESQAKHLSYIGDAHIGVKVNIGAGTITCNYDGVNKHQTIIKDNAFIGSGSQLIAPVIIGENSTIGAGTTVTHDVIDGELALSRVCQSSIANWKRSSKKNK